MMTFFRSFAIWLRRAPLRSGSLLHYLALPNSASLRFVFSILAGLFLIVSSCSRDQENRILVHGRIEGMSETIYLLEQKVTDLVKIDSVVTDENGVFSLSVHSDEFSIYALRITTDQQVVFIAGPGDSILITSKLSFGPSRIQVSGNDESELLHTFYTYSANNLHEVDSIQTIIEKNQGAENFYELTVQADSLFNQIWERQKMYEIEFIREHAGMFSSLLVVNYHFGVKPVLSPKLDAEQYRKVDSGLMANFPGNRHTLFFHQWLREVK
ncbi:MAG: DUF4369 domain-containing protein [Bacteroidales bacterium]|nr:DUF4369 domain-containing protein [Bacteroidales bacterium]